MDLPLGLPAALEAKTDVATAHTTTIPPAHKQIVQLKASYDRSGASDGAVANVQAAVIDSSDRTAQSPQDVYSKLVSATLLSITYLLAERGAYIPLGSHLMIEVPTASPAMNDMVLENEPTGLKATELQVHWATSGSLTISASPSSPVGFRQVSTAIADIDHTSDAFYGWEIRLAPSSFPAKLRAIESRSGSGTPAYDEAMPDFDRVCMIDQRQLHRRTWKSRVRGFLAARGMSISDQERWIEAELTVPHTLINACDTAVQPGTVKTETILWPAALCFFLDQPGVQSNTEHAAWLFRPMEDFFHDPLLEAETWFNARAEREAAIESKRQEKELLAASKQAASVDDGEEDTSEIYSRTNQYIDAQAINGVYPTPPDGFQPQAIGATTTNDPRTSPAGHGASIIAVDTPQGTQVAATPASMPRGFGLGSGSYVNNDDDDLFGDMDTETFATNGLTEADFSFFDEPDVVTKEIPHDKHDSYEPLVTDVHDITTTVEDMAIGRMAPSLGSSNNDEMNKSAAYKQAPFFSKKATGSILEWVRLTWISRCPVKGDKEWTSRSRRYSKPSSKPRKFAKDSTARLSYVFCYGQRFNSTDRCGESTLSSRGQAPSTSAESF